jgi:multidrug efflux pump subunit AcrB
MRVSANDLTRVARELRTELSKIDNVGLTYLVGDTDEIIRIAPDPKRLALYGVTLQQLAGKVSANRAFPAGEVTINGKSADLMVGETLYAPAEIGNLLITTRDGRPVYVRDLADISFATDSTRGSSQRSPARKTARAIDRKPAVTLAIAKRAGANAVLVAEQILERTEALEGSLIPHSMEVEVTRDYGETANEKANELLYHLGLATVSIIVLVWLAIGWREALVVAIVIPVTILLTLFAAG